MLMFKEVNNQPGPRLQQKEDFCELVAEIPQWFPSRFCCSQRHDDRIGTVSAVSVPFPTGSACSAWSAWSWAQVLFRENASGFRVESTAFTSHLQAKVARCQLQGVSRSLQKVHPHLGSLPGKEGRQ